MTNLISILIVNNRIINEYNAFMSDIKLSLRAYKYYFLQIQLIGKEFCIKF